MTTIRIMVSVSQIRLLESNCSWPKVIPLSGAHCIYEICILVSEKFIVEIETYINNSRTSGNYGTEFTSRLKPEGK
jgi:hypothetical protein